MSGEASGSAGPDSARSIGLGAVFITGAKLYFLAAGYVLIVGLQRLLGPSAYGEFALVNETVSLLNMVIVTGCMQTVAKFVSEGEFTPGAVGRAALKFQAFAGGGVALAYALAAPAIAGALNDPNLAPLFRLSAPLVFAYALYTVFIGIVNGERRFLAQAIFDTAFTTSKAALMLTAAALIGVTGAVGGFVATAVVFAVVAALVVGLRGEGRLPVADIGRLQVSITLYTLVFYLLLRTDLYFLKALADAPPEQANEMAGFYAAAQAFARVPFQAMIPVTLVLFPLISRVTHVGDAALTRSYVANAYRYALFLLVPMIAVIGGNAEAVVLLLSGPQFAASAPVLQVYAPFSLGYAMLYLATTILTGAGKPWHSVALCAAAVFADAAACAVFIPLYGMVGAAAATVAVLLAAAVVGAILVYRQTHAAPPWASVARLAAMGAAIAALAAVVPSQGVPVLAECAVEGLLFAGLLWAGGELNVADKARFMKILRRTR